MRSKFYLFLITICFAACSTPQPALQYKTNKPIGIDIVLQNAISEGLKHDNITTELALEISKMDKFFIGKCIICQSVHKALKEHKGYSKENKMRGQASNLKLVKAQGDVGKTAMKKAVMSYLDKHFKEANLTIKQIEQVQKKLMEASKKGQQLVTIYTFCPSCKGVKGACEAN